MAKSLRQQLADATEKRDALNVLIAGLEAKLADEVDPSKIQAGAFITFSHGKGENKAELQGQVLGRRDPAEGEKGKTLIKVAVGEGFDAMVLVIAPEAVTKIHFPAAEGAEADALNGVVSQ